MTFTCLLTHRTRNIHPLEELPFRFEGVTMSHIKSAVLLLASYLAFHSGLQAQDSPGLEVQDLVFDRKSLTAEVKLGNVSSKSITAYVLRVATRFLDGTITIGETLEDFVPSIPTANKVSPANKYQHFGVLVPGQTRYRILNADRREEAPDQTAGVEVSVIAVAFADSTAQGTNDDAIARIFSNRSRRALRYAEWLDKIDLIAAGNLVGRRLLENLSLEIATLSHNPDTSLDELFRQDVSSGLRLVTTGAYDAAQWLTDYRARVEGDSFLYNQHKVRR
jgi:hypothetical protein